MGNPILIVFSDASFMAYGACAYVRYQLRDGSYISNLLTAKGRLAPIDQITMPRLELLGALTSARLRDTIICEMTVQFDRVVHIVDSDIVRSQIQKESYGFGTFTATKIAEIQSKSNPDEWYWIAGDLNPADMITRPANPKDLNEDSMWQRGPQFLALPLEEWPIKKDLVMDLPDRLKVYSATAMLKGPSLTEIIQLDRFSCYYKLIRVTCRVQSIFDSKSYKGVFRYPSVKSVSRAELAWVREAQSSFSSDWRSRFRRLGPSLNADNVIIVGQRISNWLKFHYDKTGYVLLPVNHNFTKLLVASFHKTSHAGVETVLAQLQAKYWIPKVRNLIRSIQNKCVTCRKLRKQVVGQIMGQMPDERLSPAPAFTRTALDLFGPFMIKDTVKKRTRGKAYGVIFNCLTTRAVYLDLIEGYSTQAFVDGFRRFISIRGCPTSIYSDCGSQLSSFNRELQEMSQRWDKESIQDCARKYGGEIQWNFTASNAQWQNGVSEALIKSVKKSLVVAIGDSVLSFSKLQMDFIRSG